MFPETGVATGAGVGAEDGVGVAAGTGVGMKTLIIGIGFLMAPRATPLPILLMPANAAPAATIATAQVITFLTANYPATPRPCRPIHGQYEPR